MKKKMMQTGLTVAIIFLVFNVSSAHKPTTINLTYDLQNQSLSVWVGYYTESRESNYVKSIEIKVNGKTYQTYTFTRQAFKSGTVVHYYNVEAKPGDVIEVTATSTTNESKTETLNVEDAKQP